MPTDSTKIGAVARKSEPYMRQVFVTGDQEVEALNRQVILNFKVFVSSRITMINDSLVYVQVSHLAD